jgi:hypothetical protein
MERFVIFPYRLNIYTKKACSIGLCENLSTFNVSTSKIKFYNFTSAATFSMNTFLDNFKFVTP